VSLSDDPFDLQRFIDAQAGGVFETAFAELEAGRKRSHWMWFIFPQHRDLGRSPTAKFYGLSGTDEVRTYAAHPVLGRRLRAVAGVALSHLKAGTSAEAILGSIDAMKLRSSMEIFAQSVPDEPLFDEVLRALG
jgi:uncharacterized protein (DUF1810 family)